MEKIAAQPFDGEDPESLVLARYRYYSPISTSEASVGVQKEQLEFRFCLRIALEGSRLQQRMIITEMLGNVGAMDGLV